MRLLNFDNIDTWGKNLISLFEKLDVLDANVETYKKNMATKEQVMNMEMFKRFNKERPNIYNNIKDEINEREAIVYHFTRLTIDEYNSIAINGLKILNKQNQLNRIKKLEIDKDIKEKMIKVVNKEDFSDREGRIHFIYSLYSIDSGCKPFLENWGGESIYNIVEHDIAIDNKILKIGNPYIIKFKVKCKYFNTGIPIGNMQQKLKRGKMQGENSVNCDIDCKNILEINRADEILTNIVGGMK